MLVAQYQTVSQFEFGESAFECGPFAVASNKYAGQNVSTGSAEDIDSLADDLYTEFVGPNTPSDTQGIGMQQLFDMLHKVGLHYQTIGSTELNFQVDQLTPQVALEWIHAGYPIICSVAETSVFDLDLGGTPYSGWSHPRRHCRSVRGSLAG